MSIPRPSNAFDGTVDRAPRQTSMLHIIRREVKNGARALRVCLPGKVVAVNGSYSVDVQPLLQAQYTANPAPVTLPICPGVPVSMPSGADYGVLLPVAVGDCGLLIFADRSLDAWLAGAGDLVDPADARLHDLTDGIFVPGLFTDAQAAARAGVPGELAVTNGQSHVRLTKTGQVAIGNAGADLAAQTAALASQVASIATALAPLVSPPPAPPSPAMLQLAAQAQAAAAALKTIAG